MSTPGRAVPRQVLDAVVLASRAAMAAAFHWRSHPLTSRALLSALLHLPARMRFNGFESSMVLTTSQIDEFLASGWDYAEPRLQLLRAATSFPLGVEGVRRMVRMRARMEGTRDGLFEEVVSHVYRDPDYPVFQHLGQAFRNHVTGRQPFARSMLARLPRRPERVCDIGCGSGILLGDVLQAAPGATGVGVDVSDTMITHARRVLREWSLLERVDLVVGDLRRIPLPAHSADFVVATEVVEHLPDPVEGLRELARIIRPDGLVITSVPVRDTAPTHLFYFESPDDVLALHRTAGLTIVEHQVRDVAPGVPDVLVASRPAEDAPRAT